jgi:hypothetical protein
MKTKALPLTSPKIAAIDETLAVHREAWLDAPHDKKVRWWKKINELLDQRLEAMAEASRPEHAQA